jgi:hypothetical protein
MIIKQDSDRIAGLDVDNGQKKNNVIKTNNGRQNTTQQPKD